jgi:hypothetical protein
VSLFRREPVRAGLFGRPIFNTPLDQHFGWIGLATAAAGVLLACSSLGLSFSSDWDMARLYLWLLGSALLVLVGLQLIISWVLMRVLETLSLRDQRISQEMQPLATSTFSTVPGDAVAHS